MSLVRKCAWCEATHLPLSCCAKCHLVSYCGRDCQKAHWKHGHRASCSKTDVQTTFRVAGAREGILRKVLGDSSPENISLHLFRKMTKAAQEQTIVKFTEATRSTRKYKMSDVSLRWAAASTTARLAMMCMVLDDWDGADRRLRAFFRLVKRVEELEPSEAQRDEWDFDSYVTTMTQNRSVVEEILLEAEIFVTRKRVWDLEPGRNKSEQTYAFLERVIFSQALYAKLGPDYIEMNVSCRIRLICTCVAFLVDLGCTDADVENGVELSRSFEMMDNQLALAFAILDNALQHYPQREEQISKLEFFVGVVERMKEFVLLGE